MKLVCISGAFKELERGDLLFGVHLNCFFQLRSKYSLLGLFGVLIQATFLLYFLPGTDPPSWIPGSYDIKTRKVNHGTILEADSTSS